MFVIAFIFLWVKCFIGLEKNIIHGEKETDVSNIFNVSNGLWKKRIRTNVLGFFVSDYIVFFCCVFADILLISLLIK